MRRREGGGWRGGGGGGGGDCKNNKGVGGKGKRACFLKVLLGGGFRGGGVCAPRFSRGEGGGFCGVAGMEQIRRL